MTAVKGLLLRLSALDADAATAVRVIAHFEALLGGGLDPVSLTRSTAALAGCAAGLELPDGRAARFGSAGVALPGAPEQVSGRIDLEPAGRVWLERPGAPGPFDELVLEWMAITARVLAGRPRQTRVPSAADPALVELVLSGREDASDRARALRLLGLDPEAPLRVAAVTGGRGTDVGPEIGVPAEAGAAPVPNGRVGEQPGARGHQPVVECGAAQMLEADPGPAAVTGEQGRCGGQTGSGAVAPQCDPVGPDVQAAGVRRQPAQPGVAVLQRGGEGVLGGQAVVDGDHQRPQLPAEQQVPVVIDVRRTQDEAAAVDAVDGGEQPLHPLRPVDAQP